MSSDLVVLETSDLQQLGFLHQGTTRLKIVCFDLCPSLILLGANSGTIYVLDHETLLLKTQIPSGSGSVVQLSISSDESLVACALSSGLVQVFELPVSEGDVGGSGGGVWRAAVGSREHEGKEVTSLAWNVASTEVYIADASGKVSVLYITRSMTASLFRSPSMHLMTLESGVTSLSYSEGHLLVSTLTRSYICNTALETFAQVGTRLRQGEYGGCFCRVAPGSGTAHQDFIDSVEDVLEKSLNERLMLSDCYEAVEEDRGSHAVTLMEGKGTSNILIEDKGSAVVTGKPTSKIFCARPGTRIWEADYMGKVLVTHQLKSALMVPPADVLLTDGSFGEQELVEEIQRMPEADPIACHDNSLVNNSDHEVPEANVTGDYNSKKGPPGPLHPPVSVAFTKMLSFYSNYLLAISNYGLYIIDPANSKVLLWINVLDSVTDIKVSGSSLIFKTGSGCIKNFMVTPVDVAILFLHTRSLLLECAHLCLINPYIFSCSELLSRLGGKIFSDLYSFIKNDVIRARLSKLKSIANFETSRSGATRLASKAGITVVRNKNYENEEIKEGLMSALKRNHSHVLLSSVSRWYSEPVLGGRRRKSTGAKRYTSSVEGSPIHHIQDHKHSTSTSTFLYETSSCKSLTQFSSEDTLQSHSSKNSLIAEQSAVDSPEKKSHSPESDEDKRLDNLTHSSGRCSRESDSRSSHKSIESLDMYEDPLFPSDDSSPEQELASRAMSGDHLLNSYGAHPFYNLAYAPIHPGSEAATLFQDLVENVATNMVGTIASGTKSLTEKLKSVAPMMSSEEKYPSKPHDGPHSILDDRQLVNTSPDTDGTDDLENIVIRSSSKKKPRSNHHRATIQFSMTPAVPNIEEIQRPTPGIVRNLHELVTSTTEQLIYAGNKLETCSLLKHWLEKYCQTAHQIQASKRISPLASEDASGDGPISWSSVDSSHSVASAEVSCDSLNWDSSDIGFEPSAMSADTIEHITEMFIQCLQAGVYTSDFHNPHIVYGYQKLELQHSVTPEEIQKCDSLYAQLISYDCGMLHYSNILNALDSLGHNYYILTWAALLEKIGRDMDVIHNSTLPDIIPNLDFTRSQRLSLLYKVASAGNVKKFIIAAAQIENSQVLEDVIFLLNYVAQSSEMEGVTKAQIPKLLLQYLHEHSQLRDLQQTYLSHWRHCPELQYDILSALLCEVNPGPYSCRCGMPRPGVRPVALEPLAHTLLTHHLVDPKSLAVLCQSAGYWEGYCAIFLNCNLKSSKDIFPFVLQTCNPHVIQDFVETSHPQTYSLLLEGLADITCKDPLVIKCSKCLNILPLFKRSVRFDSKTNHIDRFFVNGDHPVYEESSQLEHKSPDNESYQEESPEHREGGVGRSVMEQQQQKEGCVKSMVEMWKNMVMQLLKRCGAPHTLLLLKIVQDSIPPGILSSRVYRWCVLASLAERRGASARWALLQSLSPTPTRPYSLRVARSLFRDELVSSKVSEVVEDAEVQDSPLLHDSNTGPLLSRFPPDTSSNHDRPPLAPPGSSPPDQPQTPHNGTFCQKNTSFFGHHWGVRSEVLHGLCYCCHLHLTTDALVNEGGIIVFPCSHAFHAICLSQRGHHCVICADDEPQV